MATLIFSRQSGALQSVQVGPADIIATITAAYSATGWLGGMDGVRFMLSKCNQLLWNNDNTSEQTLENLLDSQLTLQNAHVHMLTSDYGPLRCEIPNAENAFGGNKTTQLIGLTICALSHELGGHSAIDLFTGYLAPTIFQNNPLALDALRSQLREDDILQRILNEGVTHGLPDLFLKSASNLALPVGDTTWLRQMLQSDGPLFCEIQMVAGLLRWLVLTDRTTYFTRSGLVARSAGYLKAVGYNIGDITTWNGTSPPPQLSRPKGIILVLGGYSETDPLRVDRTEITQHTMQQHYTFQSVGGVFYQTIAPYTSIRPEVLQSDFESIFESIQSQLQVAYCLLRHKGREELRAKFNWTDSKRKSGSIERRLAGIYFPLLAEQLAPCYSRLATAVILDKVLDKDSREAIASYDGLTDEIARYRTTTAAIVIALTSRLSSVDFKSLRHCTEMDLSTSSWLERTCKVINLGFSSSLSMAEAVALLATIHTGHDLEDFALSKAKSKIIGNRRGIYCILPSLLLDMKPSTTSLTLTCQDVFYANIRVHHDGFIRSSTTSAIHANPVAEDTEPESRKQKSIVEMIQSPWIGPARPGPPDKPVYISIERPLHYSDPDICLAGRIDGDLIGTVSVLDVLVSIARSTTAIPACSHQDVNENLTVCNVSTSIWSSERHVKPVGTVEIPAYLAVEGDSAWALFAAGQSTYFQSCIVTKCLKCARDVVARKTTNENSGSVVLIGYHS